MCFSNFDSKYRLNKLISACKLAAPMQEWTRSAPLSSLTPIFLLCVAGEGEGGSEFAEAENGGPKKNRENRLKKTLLKMTDLVTWKLANNDSVWIKAITLLFACLCSSEISIQWLLRLVVDVTHTQFDMSLLSSELICTQQEVTLYFGPAHCGPAFSRSCIFSRPIVGRLSLWVRTRTPTQVAYR